MDQFQHLLIFFFLTAIRVLKYAILVRVLLTWVRPSGGMWMIRVIFEATEPLLKPFRKWIPLVNGLDLSPLLAWFALDLLQAGILRLLAGGF